MSPYDEKHGEGQGAGDADLVVVGTGGGGTGAEHRSAGTWIFSSAEQNCGVRGRHG